MIRFARSRNIRFTPGFGKVDVDDDDPGYRSFAGGESSNTVLTFTGIMRAAAIHTRTSLRHELQLERAARWGWTMAACNGLLQPARHKHDTDARVVRRVWNWI